MIKISFIKGSSSSGSSAGRVHCVVFLGKTVTHNASLHPGVHMGSGDFNAGVTLRWASIPSRRELEMLLVGELTTKTLI